MDTGLINTPYDPQNNPDLFSRHPEYYDEDLEKARYEKMSPKTKQLVKDLYEGLKEVSNETCFINPIQL